ncbi:MAG TPA: M56 family metallopeptidase [Planctomycetaceae bacterium]|jgi:beta-lactamase regulating signal transducer with metallopeptidase domain|nr:M56 family metallopeptidase [Planctomycetaceae bacterium]
MANDVRLVAFALLTLVTTYWLHSTLLLGATWIFARACRLRSEALRERLWKMAAVIPLFTAPLELTLHPSQPVAQIALDRLCRTGATTGVNDGAEAAPRPTNWTPPISETTVVAVARPTPRMPLDIGPPAVEIVHSSPPVAEQSAALERQAIPSSLPATPWPLALVCTVTLVGLFLAGGAVRTIWQSICFRRRLRNSRVVTGSIGDVLADVLRRVKVVRRVRLLSSPWCGQPAAFGLFHWTIVLPEQRMHDLAEDELTALFAHEVAHLVRGDALWLWICRVLCSCLSFQPLNFVVRHELRRSAEILCDEWAVRKSANAYALARCLTRVAEWDRRGLPWSEALAAIAGRSSLSERVERLIAGAALDDPWNSQRRRRMFGVAALAVAFAFACFAPRTAVTAEPQGLPAEREVSSGSPLLESSSTLAESVDLLEQEVGRLHRQMQRVDELIERAHHDPELRDWHQRLHARTATLLNCERRLVALCRARRTPAQRGDGSHGN